MIPTHFRSRGPSTRPLGGRLRTGFTMVELLVALSVSALLMGAMYDMFYVGHRVNRDTQNRSDALQAAVLTVATVQQDLKQLVSMPVDRKGSGESDTKYGDHNAPVRVSPMGRNLTFYVPDPGNKRGELPTPGAVAVTYSLEPAETGGLFHVKRTEGFGGTEEESRSRILPAVNVKDVKFRLLDPRSETPEDRSPDKNFYVETVVTGADATGRETMTLSALTQLDNPSRFQQTQNKHVQETLAFKPRAPLPQVPDRRSFTKEEREALEQMRDLAEKFDKGEVGAKELEEQVRRVIELAERQPGRKDLIATNGPGGPLGPGGLTLQPRVPGRPIEFTTPGGGSVLVPRNRDETNNRLLEELVRRGPNGGAGGGGNIRIVMTDTLETFTPTSGGGLAATSSQGRRRTGGVNYASDAGTDFSRVHDAAMNSLSQPVDGFFRSFGLPPP